MLRKCSFFITHEESFCLCGVVVVGAEAVAAEAVVLAAEAAAVAERNELPTKSKVFTTLIMLFQNIFSTTVHQSGILEVAIHCSFNITPAARNAKLVEWHNKHNNEIELFYSTSR